MLQHQEPGASQRGRGFAFQALHRARCQQSAGVQRGNVPAEPARGYAWWRGGDGDERSTD
eukprot:3923933-Prymnesium_polylepis.1